MPAPGILSGQAGGTIKHNDERSLMRTYAQQKAGLTRAIKASKASGMPMPVEQECVRVIDEWARTGWPDDWARWERALIDSRSTWKGIDYLAQAMAGFNRLGG